MELTVESVKKEIKMIDDELARRRQRSLLGFLAGVVLAPTIAPLFAGAGLAGAAATSSGLANLGLGSLASGGLGMVGGKLVVGSVAALTTALITSANNDQLLRRRRQLVELKKMIIAQLARGVNT